MDIPPIFFIRKLRILKNKLILNIFNRRFVMLKER